MNAMTILAAPESGRVFEVLLSRRLFVENGLLALNKRAARKGLPQLSWAWGQAFTRSELVPHPEYGWEVECRGKVARIPLTLTGDVPRYGGWTFLAALEHLDGENIVRVLGDAELPKVYRNRGPACDHCKLARRRGDTFVLVHEDGRHMQVGSTCLTDFLGTDAAGALAASASLLGGARGIAEQGCEGGGAPGEAGDYTLEDFLGTVAFLVRKEGWVSRGAARDATGDTMSATADRAWKFLDSAELAKKSGVSPEEEDGAMALAAEVWASNLTDAEVDAEKGDYLHNLRAVARNGVVNKKSMGIAASMVTAHQKHIARERLRAERVATRVDVYVGTEGERRLFAPLTLVFVSGYESMYGYTTVCKFQNADGATIVWKSTSTSISRADVGKKYAVKGTVKSHEEYKGRGGAEKQTLLGRCDAEEMGTPGAEYLLAEQAKADARAAKKAAKAAKGA